MDKEEPSSKQLPPEIVASLLHDAVQAQKHGSHTKARSLLRVLTIHHPEETRAWLLLATVAADRDEQRSALEQVIAREPDHPLAKRGLANLQNTTPHKPATDGADSQTKPISKIASFVPSTTKSPSKDTSPQPEKEQPDEKSATNADRLPHVSEELTTSTKKEEMLDSSVHMDTSPKPLPHQDKSTAEEEESFSEVTSTLPTEQYGTKVQSPGKEGNKEHQPDSTAPKTTKKTTLPTVAAQFLERVTRFRWLLYVILVITVIFFFLVILLQSTSPEQEDVERFDPTPPLPGARRTQPSFASNVQPEATESNVVAIPLVSTDNAPPTRTPTPTPEPELTISALALGRPVQQDDWYLSLLRAEDAVVVRETIGNIKPDGQFLVVLMAVNNISTEAMQMPTNLITLLDSDQNRYEALPHASTVYLDKYGRGQYGDLSMEEFIPPGGGNVSVPLIFDIPMTANDFQLYMAEVNAAWPIDTSFIAVTPTILPTMVLTPTITPTP